MDLQQVKQFLRVDYDDDDTLIEVFIEVARKYVSNGFNEYNDENPNHKLLLLKAVKTLYDNREDNDDRVYSSIKLHEILGDSSEQ